MDGVKISAALDSHTCEECGDLDGTVVRLADAVPGVTTPPYHPNCRCTTMPYEDEMEEYRDALTDPERIARDEAGQSYYVPKDMRYKEWAETFLVPPKETEEQRAAREERKAKLAVAAQALTGRRAYARTKRVLPSSAKSDTILGVKKARGNDVRFVGRIDLERFSQHFPDITTDEVIITDERIEHIEKRHPGTYEKYGQYIPEVLEGFQYALEDDLPNTALLLKQLEGADGDRLELVLRIHTSQDNSEFKNSVLSLWKIGEVKWNQYKRTKKILDKRE
jgi:hypothetical protein